VSELKFDVGPGYRVYFGQDGVDLILLLVGGDKGSQRKGISKAQQYWTEYKSGDKNGTKK
jgi:putative addiction module killer protein